MDVYALTAADFVLLVLLAYVLLWIIPQRILNWLAVLRARANLQIHRN